MIILFKVSDWNYKKSQPILSEAEIRKLPRIEQIEYRRNISAMAKVGKRKKGKRK